VIRRFYYLWSLRVISGKKNYRWNLHVTNLTLKSTTYKSVEFTIALKYSRKGRCTRWGGGTILRNWLRRKRMPISATDGCVGMKTQFWMTWRQKTKSKFGTSVEGNDERKAQWLHAVDYDHALFNACYWCLPI